jgi:hypothetical protein
MNYKFIGWCRADNHDKVWGVIALHSDSYVTFWGRRGAKLQTKISNDLWAVNDLIYKKQLKGYKSIQRDEIDTVYPEFQADLEKTAFWAMLKA